MLGNRHRKKLLGKRIVDALEEAYAKAEVRRDKVRRVLSEVTCEALKIEEEKYSKSFIIFPVVFMINQFNEINVVP